jgi:small ligand-binding sensory domain FIST
MTTLSNGLRFASAIAEHSHTREALDSIVQQIAPKLDGQADLVVIFASGDHQKFFEQIHEQIASDLSAQTVLAISAAGVIGKQRELEGDGGLSVLAAKLPNVLVEPFHYDEVNWPNVLEPNEDMLDENGLPKAILLFADPFSTPMINLLPALGDCWPEVPVIGGMASGARDPGGNSLMLNGKVFHQGAVGLTLGGQLRVDTTVSQGCRPVGKPYVITKTQRNVIMELGGLSALEVVQDMVRDISDQDQQLLQSQPLMVGRVINEYKDRFGPGDFLIRSILGIDRKSGYIAVGDTQIRVGQTIQFHIRDQQAARQDFSLLLQAQKLHGTVPEGTQGTNINPDSIDCGALLFSCNGRGTQLFDQPNADADMIYDALGQIPLAGFFAAGEIGPVGQENFVHGHTASLIVLRPDGS